MKYVYIGLNWVFGLSFLFGGLYVAVQSPLGGLMLILTALLLLPPARTFAHSKTNLQIPLKARGFLICVLFIGFGYFLAQSSAQQRQEIAAAEAQAAAEKREAKRQENIDYFNANSAQILADGRVAFDNQEFAQVTRLTTKYLSNQNEELLKLHRDAKAELEVLADAERATRQQADREKNTKEILAKLKTIPASQYAQNRNLYKQLADMYPDNKTYGQKLDYYTAKLKEKREAEQKKKQQANIERAARLAAFGEPPVKSPWDGSYHEVERYLEQVANDPDSIDIDACTNVRYTNSGWLIGCEYRGKNGFGGMVRQSNWFTVVHGSVIQMHDSSKYAP